MGQFEYFLEQNTKLREKQFCDCLRECMEKRNGYLEKDVRMVYEENKEDITESFRAAFREGIRQVEIMQTSYVKELICYIHLSYLLSNALTGENKVKIDFYDRRYFADLQEVDCFWDYGVLFPTYKQELFEMESQMRQEVPRLTLYELQKARTYFQVENFIVLGSILRTLIKEAEIREYAGRYLAPEARVFYGAYLDQAELICKWERERG
ncbi:MAG: hypothetical protein HDQ96_16250 [Lachnospiraceae bacterium]|nr:hypothetical protein [Lachnospiraceae bacterium]